MIRVILNGIFSGIIFFSTYFLYQVISNLDRYSLEHGRTLIGFWALALYIGIVHFFYNSKAMESNGHL